MEFIKNIFLWIVVGVTGLVLEADPVQPSRVVELDSDGVLVYHPDSNGNVVPDFSMVGYRGGISSIPDNPVVVALSPIPGDNRNQIQEAISQVAALTPDAKGHRGTILLTAGYYQVSSTIFIEKSGIVLRGEGPGSDGTEIEFTAKRRDNLFEIKGSGGRSEDVSSRSVVTDHFVPIGSKHLSVESGEQFEVGDRVLLVYETNQAWIDLLEMGDYGWTPEYYVMKYERVVLGISGGTIRLNAPIVEPINAEYGRFSVVKYEYRERIEECGIESMKLTSSYVDETDEEHGWTAIDIKNAENVWVRNVDAYFFAFACVNLGSGTLNASVENCGMFDYKSRVTGGRRYGFNINNAQMALIRDCRGRDGRHDFVTGSKTLGPSVFLNCVSEDSTSDIGPHHRWATGILYENVSSDGIIRVQNRQSHGSGHGWAGVQQMLWNCSAESIVLHQPPKDYINWAIGCTGEITNVGTKTTEPIGFVESWGKAKPFSLYQQQLKLRIAEVTRVHSAGEGNASGIGEGFDSENFGSGASKNQLGSYLVR